MKLWVFCVIIVFGSLFLISLIFGFFSLSLLNSNCSSKYLTKIKGVNFVAEDAQSVATALNNKYNCTFEITNTYKEFNKTKIITQSTNQALTIQLVYYSNFTRYDLKFSNCKNIQEIPAYDKSYLDKGSVAVWNSKLFFYSEASGNCKYPVVIYDR